MQCKMRRHILLLVSLIMMLACPSAVFSKTEIGSEEVKSILKRLDAELAGRNKYINKRHASIDSLKNIVSSKSISDEERLGCLLQLGDSYNVLNTDSALTFYAKGYELAEKLGLDSVSIRFNLRTSTYLPLLAFITEASKRFESIDPETIPEGLLEEYYDAARQMYFYIASYYVNYPDIHGPYMKKSQEAQAKLLTLLEDGTPRFMLNQGEIGRAHV